MSAAILTRVGYTRDGNIFYGSDYTSVSKIRYPTAPNMLRYAEIPSALAYI